MSLLSYYSFLIVGVVLCVVLRKVADLRQYSALIFGVLLLPPLILVLNVLNLSLIPGLVLALILLAAISLFARRKAFWETRRLMTSWVVVWIIEAATPIAIQVVFRGRPNLETRLQLLMGLIILTGIVLLNIFSVALRRDA